jgi:hypothetical protein
VNDNLHIPAECVQKVHQPLDGEAFQPVIGKRRDLGLVDAKATSSVGLGETPPLQNLVDRKREANLSLALLGVGEPQVGKNVPGTRGDDRVLFILGRDAPGIPCGLASSAPRDGIPRLLSIETSLNQGLVKHVAGNAGFKPKLDRLPQ